MGFKLQACIIIPALQTSDSKGQLRTIKNHGTPSYARLDFLQVVVPIPITIMSRYSSTYHISIIVVNRNWLSFDSSVEHLVYISGDFNLQSWTPEESRIHPRDQL